MTVPEEPAAQPVGCLVFRSTSQPESHGERFVIPNEHFDIGRQQVNDLLGIEDRSVSNHHLRFHCVVYDDDENSKVAPMVYMRVLSLNAVIWHRNGLDEANDGIPVDRSFGDVLLNTGDSVQLTQKIWIDFPELSGQLSSPPALDSIRRREVGVEAFLSRYRLSTRVLGIGGYAAVYVANRQSDGKQLACKIVHRHLNLTGEYLHQHSTLTEEELQRKRETTAREFNVLKKLSHPNIVSLEKVICTPYNVYIFQELITGGDLLSYLDKKGPLAEPQAAVITRQLLEAVKYLHANNVVHRDIKPENILMTSWRDGSRIVLTDFGQSRTIEDLENVARKAGVFRMQSLVGTPGYAAPEIYRQKRKDFEEISGYSKAIDIWSVGCVVTTMLSNDFIFPDGDGQGEELPQSQYAECLEALDREGRWSHIGHGAKALIKGCLDTDENKRLTAPQALAMPWFTHPHYRAEFDAAYKRAIQEWKQRPYDVDIIEEMDTTKIVQPILPRKGEVHSRHFPPLAPKPTEPDPSEVARFRPNELNASPAVPDSSPRQQDERGASHRVQSETQLTLGEREYGDDAFHNLSMEDFDDLDQPRAAGDKLPAVQDSFWDSIPPPPSLTQKVMYR